jgi:hypothetical protein
MWKTFILFCHAKRPRKLILFSLGKRLRNNMNLNLFKLIKGFFQFSNVDVKQTKIYIVHTVFRKRYFFLAQSFFFVSFFWFCTMESPKSMCCFGNRIFLVFKSFLFDLKMQQYFFFVFCRFIFSVCFVKLGGF